MSVAKKRLGLALLIVGVLAYPAWRILNPPASKPRPGHSSELLRPEDRCHPLDDVERQIRDRVSARPDLFESRAKLISLLTLQCRTYEANVERQVLLRSGKWQVEDLLALAKPEDLVSSPDLKPLLNQDPHNPRLLLAEARLALLDNRLGEAKKWIDKAFAEGPSLVDVHAVHGLYLLEQDPSESSLVKWQKALPDDADEHPDVWTVRGVLARKQQDDAGAVRCFAEALLRFPDHRRATHQLSLAMATLGNDRRAAKLSERVRYMDQLSRSVDDIYLRSDWDEPWLRGANMLEQLGRIPEAVAWYRLIVQNNFGGVAAEKKAAELAAKLTVSTPTIAPAAHPVAGLNLSSYPIPKFDVATKSGSPIVSHPPSDMRFADVANSVGLDFSYYGAEKPVMRVRPLVQLFGGGLGVLDLDQDGWPDVYCSQGAPFADNDPPGKYPDRLFRNVDGSFTDITELSGLGDESLSYGVAVGDFNCDGFPDLWVGNWGENKLYVNNGDGTFSDVSRGINSDAGLSAPAWTSSGVIADFNGDGLPDIFEVNYLGGPRVATAVCLGGEDCSPAAFPAAPDRFLLNLGDGTFADRTAELGLAADDGKGLGIVVGDFDGDGVVSAFVANDGVPNHFFVNVASRGAPLSFSDRAPLHGLAYDGNGLSQGCMGIAVDDVDGNGLLDLFVTNFYGESNILYTEQKMRLFSDETQEHGLRSASRSMVGFGTEFIDVDLDGDPDLVVSNGQIDGLRSENEGFQMRPQLFENRNGRFYERKAADVAPYFAKEFVGRTLVRIDFNRDGREDFAVSHLDAPVALLRNQSPQSGHFLAVQLRGVSCNRDAVGATVTLVMRDGRRRVRQVTAGDGYQCANQQQLIFGLAAETEVAKVIVRWPTQDEQEFSDVKADRELLIVQGQTQPVELPPGRE
jgi:tetratricopeptide (TPR) repeat protein